MQKIFRCRKFIGLITLISTLLICFLLSPVQAVMINTEYVIHQESKKLSYRVRVSTFLRRADVIAQIQAFGISSEEAQSRADSLTDNEIASLAGKIDQIQAGAGGNNSDTSLSLLGLALYAIIAVIVLFFAFVDEKEDKP